MSGIPSIVATIALFTAPIWFPLLVEWLNGNDLAARARILIRASPQKKMIEMCPVCKKCHKFKKKSIYRQHERTCIPTTEDASWGAITGRVGKELRKKMKKG